MININLEDMSFCFQFKLVTVFFLLSSCQTNIDENQSSKIENSTTPVAATKTLAEEQAAITSTQKAAIPERLDPTGSWQTGKIPVHKPHATLEGAVLAGNKRKLKDKSNVSYQIIQDPTTAMADFPHDDLGNPDWVKTLRRGLITPRASIHGAGRMEVLDLNIIMKDTRQMAWVKFPHRAHTEWLACSNCHPSPFIKKTGANPITMELNFRGKYCGVCHDKVAFSVYNCDRCHNAEKKPN
ncbi:hypothetical protein BMS3Bbin11_01135 [bacterium BMS3Bbin11]|nr:hypothetical protein BMS3Abin11_00416 [bacterium BMS3Abin11]GBE46040.1 hypothetical protein BMS3Bbin11_01135 [bacterium BMS3Bbin11]HDH09204.1 hypothetical protein [Gammaproteobacteria bacterium]HDH16651.1 hypothetical protein [Gammaproteobacteria bacterium]HDZ79020.1 hypothetical protein [Gammaproteobacteria bacterium]